MGSEVSAGWVRADQVVFREEVVGARVVAGGEVDLGKPKGVVIVFCVRWDGWDGSSARGERDGRVFRGGCRTCHCQQLVADEDGRVVLGLVEGILAPVTEKPLHVWL